MNGTNLPRAENPGQLIQVVVCTQSGEDKPAITIDPWDNCPSQVGREEGWSCEDCEFWGGEVRGIDWSEFSLCLFDGTEDSEPE